MLSQKNTHVIRAKQPFSDWLHRIWHRRETLWFFVWKDLKVQYERPIFGLLWSIFQPLVYFTVILGVMHFSGRSTVETGIPFELYLLCGLSIWNFVTSAIMGAINSMQSNAGLVSKASFPRLYLVLAPFIKSLFDLAIVFLIVVVASLLLQVPIGIELIVFLLATLALIIPTALGLASISVVLIVHNRHVRHVFPILLYALIFALPIFYSMHEMSNPWLQLAYRFNPIAGAMELLRTGFHPSDFCSNMLLPWLTTSAIIACLGLAMFKKTEQVLADQA